MKVNQQYLQERIFSDPSMSIFIQIFFADSIWQFLNKELTLREGTENRLVPSVLVVLSPNSLPNNGPIFISPSNFSYSRIEQRYLIFKIRIY